VVAAAEVVGAAVAGLVVAAAVVAAEVVVAGAVAAGVVEAVLEQPVMTIALISAAANGIRSFFIFLPLFIFLAFSTLSSDPLSGRIQDAG
jgi:hypothetical protein